MYVFLCCKVLSFNLSCRPLLTSLTTNLYVSFLSNKLQFDRQPVCSRFLEKQGVTWREVYQARSYLPDEHFPGISATTCCIKINYYESQRFFHSVYRSTLIFTSFRKD